MKNLILIIALGVGLTSCSEWFDTQKEEFQKQCHEGIDKGYKNAGNFNYDEEKVDEVCDCALEKVQKDHSFESFNNLNGEEKNEYIKDCFEEVFDIELD